MIAIGFKKIHETRFKGCLFPLKVGGERPKRPWQYELHRVFLPSSCLFAPKHDCVVLTSNSQIDEQYMNSTMSDFSLFWTKNTENLTT